MKASPYRFPSDPQVFSNVTVEPEAELALSELPGGPVQAVAVAINHWGMEHDSRTHALRALQDGWTGEYARIESLRIFELREPDDPSWVEVVFELALDTDTKHALQAWSEIARRIDDAKARLSADERAVLDSSIGVHVVWTKE